MSISSAVCMDTLRALIQRGFLSIEQDQQQNALICERYSLKPLWEKLIHHMMQETREVEKAKKNKKSLIYIRCLKKSLAEHCLRLNAKR